ncbi:MAG: sugar phosphate isomerase/epimerase [Paludibacter sp.]|nr:sugar phosphate isomerase/epimerase [Paludibacter sp.]
MDNQKKINFIKTLTIACCLLAIATFVNGQSNRQPQSGHVPELSAYNFGSLGKLAPSTQIALLKKTGYKGVILNSETKDDSANLDIFLNELRNDKHFKVHAVMVRYNFADPLQKREGWKTTIDRIANKRIELWFIFGKKIDGITDRFIETKLKEVVEYAKTKNVPVILYPHSKCYIASAEEALPFVQKINDPNLKLAVHLCHEIRAGNGSRIDAVFEHVKKHIGAVTMAGTDSVADFSKPVLMDKSTIKPIGQGNFNMRNFIEPLRKSTYKGSVGFINFKIEDDPEVYLENSISVWRKSNELIKNDTTRK